MEIFLFTEGEEPARVHIEGTALVREILAIGEPDGAEVVMIEEVEEPLDLDITVEAAGIGHHHNVHRGRCRKVHVHIRFNGVKKGREFNPGASIRHVFHWATGPEAFNLSPDQKAAHVLALPGADHFLDWDVRVGSVVTPGTCEVTLDLAPKSRFEG
jgi:hypothetical protein